jgi:hypothetical protein
MTPAQLRLQKKLLKMTPPEQRKTRQFAGFTMSVLLFRTENLKDASIPNVMCP